MNKNEINELYFEWMSDLVENDGRKSYQKLLYLLHDTDFTYSLAMDGNRYEDGIDLRYRFARESELDERIVADILDDKPCSVLEMMTALALRLEEHIMSDPDIGNRTGTWFWDMISSLGLSGMDDTHFRQKKAIDILERFLDREYEPNGKGGLFTLHRCPYDLRGIEIWYQANWFLNETN